MKLNDSEFKKWKDLKTKVESGEATDVEKSEFEKLDIKKRKGKKDKLPYGNDFGWWNKYPHLMKDAAAIPFNYIPGTPLFNGTKTHSGRPYGVSNVMAVEFEDVYGSESTATGPINMAARNLYLAMHRQYRGIGAYQSSDLGMVVIATIELIKYTSVLERIYGVINHYSIINRSLPYALLAAMGVSSNTADDIRKNLNDFRSGLNVLILKAQNVCIPRDISMLWNKIALYAFVYKDHDDDKAQAVVFNPRRYGKYSHAPSGACVRFVERPVLKLSVDYTYTDLLNYLDELISALVEDDDVVRIYSDLVAYMGVDKLLTVMPLPENHAIVPVYSEEILHKLHNAMSISETWEIDSEGLSYGLSGATHGVVFLRPDGANIPVGWFEDADESTIYQLNNIIHTQAVIADGNASFQTGSYEGIDYPNVPVFDGEYVVPMVTNGSTYLGSLLDTYRKDPTEEAICEGCLWKFGIHTRTTAGATACYISTCASEIINKMDIFATSGGNISQNIPVVQYHYESGYDTNIPGYTYRDMKNVDLRSECALSLFDWRPISYRIEDDDINSLYFDGSSPIGGDICNVRVVYPEDFKRVQEVALYSAFSIGLIEPNKK